MVDTFRGASSAFQTAIQADLQRPIHLFYLALTDYPVYLTDANMDVVWDGHTWEATGGLLSIGMVDETRRLQSQSISVALSGVATTYISLLLNYKYMGVDVEIYRAYLDADHELIVDPMEYFVGRVTTVIFDESPEDHTITVSLEIADNWTDFERRSGRRTNAASQRLHYPGDAGMDYAGDILTDVEWNVGVNAWTGIINGYDLRGRGR